MNKSSGDDRISAELFHILKDNAVKVLHSICQQMLKTAMATELEKVSFHSSPKKANAKKFSNGHTIDLISHASNAQNSLIRLQQYMN